MSAANRNIRSFQTNSEDVSPFTSPRPRLAHVINTEQVHPQIIKSSSVDTDRPSKKPRTSLVAEKYGRIQGTKCPECGRNFPDEEVLGWHLERELNDIQRGGERNAMVQTFAGRGKISTSEGGSKDFLQEANHSPSQWSIQKASSPYAPRSSIRASEANISEPPIGNALSRPRPRLSDDTHKRYTSESNLDLKDIKDMLPDAKSLPRRTQPQNSAEEEKEMWNTLISDAKASLAAVLTPERGGTKDINEETRSLAEENQFQTKPGTRKEVPNFFDFKFLAKGNHPSRDRYQKNNLGQEDPMDIDTSFTTLSQTEDQRRNDSTVLFGLKERPAEGSVKPIQSSVSTSAITIGLQNYLRLNQRALRNIDTRLVLLEAEKSKLKSQQDSLEARKARFEIEKTDQKLNSCDTQQSKTPAIDDDRNRLDAREIDLATKYDRLKTREIELETKRAKIDALIKATTESLAKEGGFFGTENKTDQIRMEPTYKDTRAEILRATSHSQIGPKVIFTGSQDSSTRASKVSILTAMPDQVKGPEQGANPSRFETGNINPSASKSFPANREIIDSEHYTLGKSFFRHCYRSKEASHRDDERETYISNSGDEAFGVQTKGFRWGEPGFVSERATKLQIICFLLNLTFTHELFTRTGRESSISSSIIDGEGAFESDDAADNENANSTKERSDAGKNTQTQRSNQQCLKSSDKGHGSGGSGKSRLCRDNNEDDEDRKRQPKKPPRDCHRRLRSLGGKLACPYAKAHPEKNLPCVMIGRRDLAGVKEHVKRNHFSWRSQPGLLAARTWDAVFDFCIPEWHPNPRPSPYIDMLELFSNFLLSNSKETGENSGQERWHTLADGNLGMGSYVDESYVAVSADPSISSSLPANDVPCLSGEGSSLDGNFHDISITPASGAASEERTMAYPREANSATSNIHESDYVILDPPIIQTIQTATPEAVIQNTSPNFSPYLNDLISNAAGPHLKWPLSDDSQAEFSQAPNFFRSQFGIDMTMPYESLYATVMAQLDPCQIYYNPSIGFDLPFLHSNIVVPEAPVHLQSHLQSFGYTTQDGNFQMDPLYNQIDMLFPSTTVTPVPTTESSSTSTEATMGSGSSSLSTATTSDNTVEKKYTLFVSRFHAIPNSSEPQGYKEFQFNGFKEFAAEFERWMAWEFTDPAFSWDTMKLLNDKTSVNLTNLKEVMRDVRGTFAHYRDCEASLFLVMQDKGKRRAD